MIGCDIIQFQDHWKVNTIAPRRLQKLYHLSELALLHQIHHDSKVAEAVLWSSKESTYKACYEGVPAFNPKLFCLKSIEQNELQIQYDDIKYRVQFMINENVVFTSLTDPTIKGYYYSIEKHEGNESLEARSRICGYLNYTYGGNWEVRKSVNGKPLLFRDNKLSTKKVSLSHHQGYIAFVLCD